VKTSRCPCLVPLFCSPAAALVPRFQPSPGQGSSTEKTLISLTGANGLAMLDSATPILFSASNSPLAPMISYEGLSRVFLVPVTIPVRKVLTRLRSIPCPLSNLADILVPAAGFALSHQAPPSHRHFLFHANKFVAVLWLAPPWRHFSVNGFLKRRPMACDFFPRVIPNALIEPLCRARGRAQLDRPSLVRSSQPPVSTLVTRACLSVWSVLIPAVAFNSWCAA